MQHGMLGALREGRRPRQALVQHTAQRIHIGPRIDRSTLDLLGRRVLDGAEEVSRRCETSGGRLLSNTEVGQVGVIGALLEEDVPGLHVSVDESVCVSRIECTGELFDQEDRAPDAKTAALEDLLEVRALHETHCDVEQPVLLAGVVDRNDVGVVDGRRNVRLTHEPLPELLIPGQLGGEDLERHLSPQAKLLGHVDDAHAAAAENGFDPKSRDFGADACGCRHLEGDAHYPPLSRESPG